MKKQTVMLNGATGELAKFNGVPFYVECKDSGKKDIEVKTLGGHLTSVKTVHRDDGVEVGIVEGYIATWDLDRGDGWLRDQFVKGAFRKSIRDLKKRDRQLRLKDGHGRVVGGFPPGTLKEDDRGLFGIGEINLEVQQGKELFSMIQQGVLTDFSIGFSVVKSSRDEQNDIRTITEAIAWEGSIVDEPMNPEAQITDVKNEGKNMDPVTEEEVKSMTKRDLEDALREGKEFTKQAAKTVASLFDGQKPPETEEEKTARKKQEAKDLQLANEEKDLTDISTAIKECTSSLKK